MRHLLAAGRRIVSLALALAVISLAACGETEPSGPDLVGTWVGSYGGLGGGAGVQFALLLAADGELGVIDGPGFTPEAAGTWSLTGNIVTGTWTYDVGGETRSFSGVLSGNDDELEGTWGEGSNTSGAGTFEVHKQ